MLEFMKKRSHSNVKLGFFVKREMNNHIASNHNGEKTFKCKLCDKCYVAKNGLGAHMVSFHEGKNLLNATFVRNILQVKRI